MIARRDILIGGACLLGVGLGYAVTPHRHVTLMGKKKFAQLIPTAFPNWTSRDASDLAPPIEQGTIAARIYDEVVERTYTNIRTGDQVMMLVAHGPAQTNELMLHRPEKCYPANGYTITSNSPVQLTFAPGAQLPARQLVADSNGGRENIVYWTRLGEYMPTDNTEQRRDRLKTVLHGVVADGVLARFSAISPNPAPAMAMLERFINGLVWAIEPDERRTLIGTPLAADLAAQKSV